MKAVWLLLALAFAPTLGKELCEEHLRTKVLVGKVRPDGSLQVPDDGAGALFYPKDTYWKEKHSWWACPCRLGKCVRQCKRSLARAKGVEMARHPVAIDIWIGDRRQQVLMSEHFHIIDEGWCVSGGYFLEEDIELDEFRILSNGSIYFSHPNITNDAERMISVENSCIIPEHGKVGAFICMPPEPQDLKFTIYPIFFVISAVFLLLTLIAFFLTPDHHTIHVRSVVCQSGSLLMAYIGLTINYTIGDTSHINTCIITAYVTYYFLLANFFWLNVMCIDIYITFSGLVDRANERAFLKFSVYAWCAPLIIFTITVVLDRTTKHDSLSPGIGKSTCWFSNVWSQLLYFSGPVLILLLINSYLFAVTALKVWRVKRDLGRMMHSEDSKVHGRKAKQQEQDKDRLKLFIKLFLLMGCTWFMEIISWAVGGPSAIWYVPDAINCLRGVLIFWFCVWSNRTIRAQLRERFGSSKNKTASFAPTTSSVFSVASSSKTL
ncbi:G-protein coupled receptor Mth2-like [Cloeon dipterum]|uniref:G-protein coupled receptor Mth2-like n=1 Tax=Cloeon dipterum TaxID=197152 RepID=UPI00321FB09A